MAIVHLPRYQRYIIMLAGLGTGYYIWNESLKQYSKQNFSNKVLTKVIILKLINSTNGIIIIVKGNIRCQEINHFCMWEQELHYMFIYFMHIGFQKRCSKCYGQYNTEKYANIIYNKCIEKECIGIECKIGNHI